MYRKLLFGTDHMSGADTKYQKKWGGGGVNIYVKY